MSKQTITVSDDIPWAAKGRDPPKVKDSNQSHPYRANQQKNVNKCQESRFKTSNKPTAKQKTN